MDLDFPDVGQVELNVRLVESCHLLARDKKVIIWGQGTHLLGMDRFPALNLPAPQNSKHTCTLIRTHLLQGDNSVCLGVIPYTPYTSVHIHLTHVPAPYFVASNLFSFFFSANKTFPVLSVSGSASLASLPFPAVNPHVS